MLEPLSLEQRIVIARSVRCLLLRCRMAFNDPVSCHVGSRDLQRHLGYLPEAVCKEFDLKFPSIFYSLMTEITKFPTDEEFFSMLAAENGWELQEPLS